MVSIIIPSRGETLGLWATVASIKESFLCSSPEPYEIIAVLNEPEGAEFPPVGFLMKQMDFCHVVFSNAKGPGAARNVGAARARGDFLFFCDAHCLFPTNFFWILRAYARIRKAATVFGGTKFMDDTTYGCTVGWEDILWGANVVRAEGKDPFEIVSAGHGVFGIERKVFEACGGYWEELRGWGGEEPQLNFKLWLLGYRALMVPETYHWHYTPPGARRGFEVYQDRDFVRNFLLVAAAYADRDQVLRSYDAFQLYFWQGKELYQDVLEEVLNSSAVKSERAFMAQHARYKSLAELRVMLRETNVVA